MKATAFAAALLLLAGGASAQQYSQPIPNQNQTQQETSQGQQPPNARGSAERGSTGQSTNQPIPNQNQTQQQQNQSQGRVRQSQ